MTDFNTITPEWVKAQLSARGMKGKELASALNTDATTVSRWLTGRSPIGAIAKAGIFYYFKALESSEKEFTYREVSELMELARINPGMAVSHLIDRND